MATCCPICYKIGHNPAKTLFENCTLLKREELVQQRFFKFFQRYLNDGNEEDENNLSKKRKQPPELGYSKLEKLSEIGMLACQDCLRQMESFCDLYDKLKTTELLLNWKVWTVKNIMTGAQRVTSRVKYFREFIDKVEVELEEEGNCWESGDSIINFIAKSRKSLIRKCSRKVENVTPVLSIARWEPGGQEISTTSSIENEDTRRDVDTANANKSVIRGASKTEETNGKKTVESSKLVSMSPSPFDVSIAEDINAEDSIFIDIDHGDPSNNEEDDDHQNLSNSFSKIITEECADANEKSPYFDNFSGTVKIETDSEFVEESFTEPATASEVYQNNVTSSNMESDEGIHRPLPALESVLCLNTVRNDNGEETLPLEPETITGGTPSNSTASRTCDGTLNPETRFRLRPTHKCHKCGRTFSTGDRLQSHEQEAHNDGDDNFNDLESILSVDGHIDIDGMDGSPTLSSSSSSSDESDNDFDSLPDTEEEIPETKVSIKSPLDEVATTGPLSQTIPEVRNTYKPVKHPKFRLRCPDCHTLFEDVQGILTHRTFSATCARFYDPKVKINVDVLVSPSKSGNTSKDECGDDGSHYSVVFAKISLPQEIYFCEKCDLAVYSSYDMEVHNKLHGTFPCQFCGAKKDYAPELSRHELEHAVTEGELKKTNGNHPIFYCVRCDYGVADFESYIVHHLKTHLGLVVKKSKCAICKTNGNALTNTNLATHLKSHHDLTGISSQVALYTCPEQHCGAYFLKKFQLNWHMEMRHRITKNGQLIFTAKNNGRRRPTGKTGLSRIENESASLGESELRQQNHSSESEEGVNLQDNSSSEKNKPTTQSDSKLNMNIAKAKDGSDFNPSVAIDTSSQKLGTNGRYFRLKCPDCKHLFRDVKSLLIHRRDSQLCSGTYDPNVSIKVEVVVPSPGVKRKETIVSYRIADKYFTNIFAIIDLPQTMFRCEDCDLEFYSSESLEAHKTLHGKFKCNFCPMELTYAKNLAIHELQHFREKGKCRKIVDVDKLYESVNCPRCGLSLSCSKRSQSQYVRHHLSHHMSLKWLDEPLCAICKTTMTTLTKKGLGEHFRTCHDLSKISNPREIVRCQIGECDAYFLTRKQLCGHLGYHHNLIGKEQKRTEGNIRVNCKDCDKSYVVPNALRMHRLKHHVPLDKVFPCPFKKCNLVYETRQELELHLASFKERHKALDKPKVKEFVNCPVCDKRISDRHSSFMKGHMKTHEASHVCEECGKQFKIRSVLETHKLSHSGSESWKFSCNVCGKKCLDKGKLNEHMRTHTKETPYVCEICGQKYAHRHNLRIHVNNKHGDEVQDIPRKINTKNFTSKKGIKRKKIEENDSSEDEDQ